MAGAGTAARARRWLGGGSLIAALFALAFAAPAAAAPSTVLLGTFSQPTWAGAPASEPSRVFVTERAGRMWVLVDGVQREFLDLTAMVESAAGERGLLSAAFPPDYADSGRFYVYLTAREPFGTIEIWEFSRSADPNAADPLSRRRLLSIPHNQAANHNGGQVQVGPDGKLWLATGDGGGSNNQFGHAQNPTSRLGKLLTVDPVTGDVEIVARGLRNPWRFSFAPDGRIVIGDVGQGRWEELNVGLADNYGWPCKEGFEAHRPDPGCENVPLHDPLLVRGHGTPYHCSIVAGYVVRDPGLPTLVGRHIYGDYCAAALRSVDLDNAAGDGEVGLSVQALSSFGEDACGRVLAVSLNGPVYRLVDGAPTPCGEGVPTPTPTPSPTPSPTPTPTPTATPTPTPTPTPSPTPTPMPSPTPTPTATPTPTPTPSPTATPAPTPSATLAPSPLPAAAPPAWAPAAAPPAPAPAATRCAISLRVTGLRSLGRRHFLSIALRTDRPCRARLSGRVAGVARFRARRVRLVPGRRTVVRLRVAKARAVARALPRWVTLRVRADGRAVTTRVRAHR